MKNFNDRQVKTTKFNSHTSACINVSQGDNLIKTNITTEA